MKSNPRYKSELEKCDTGKEKWNKCKDICATDEKCRDVLNKHDEEISVAKKICDEKVSQVMEQEWGFDALHTGNFPKHWVKPGGLKPMDYRTTSDAMLSSDDVLKTKELKSLKCMKEGELFSRLANITNHTRTH